MQEQAIQKNNTRQPLPKAYKDVAGSTARIVVCQGGTRSGKTYNITKALIAFCWHNKNRRLKIEIVRKTFVSLAESVMADFFEILDVEGYYQKRLHNQQRNTYQLFGNTIKFTGVDQAQRKRGTKRDILFVNEANELTWDEFFQLNIRTKFKTICDFNPSMEEEHWLFTRVMPRMDCETFITTYKDNPYLTAMEVREIELLRDTDPYYWSVFGLGINAKNPARIYQYREIKEVPEGIQFLGYGLDFGFTSSPTCLIAVYKRLIYDDEGQLVAKDLILDEVIYGTGLLNHDINERLLLEKVDKHQPIMADSEDPKTIAELKRMGWRVISVKKPKDGIPWGIQHIKSFRIYVTERSINVKKDFRLYKFQQDKGGRILNEPLKKDDHAPDALRYVMLHTAYKGKYVLQ